VLRVAETGLKVAALYKNMGGDITFTKQELIFAALHHDLGKLGDPDEGPYYVNQDSDWHRKRGELYTHNENLQYFKAP
jgi:predicted HD phosphohydrolase